MNIVRFARLRAGLSQQQLAERAGISQPALARIESGRITPRLDTVDRLLQQAGMSLEAVPRSAIGIDRTTIRRMLRLTPRQRLLLAKREAQNLRAITAARRR